MSKKRCNEKKRRNYKSDMQSAQDIMEDYFPCLVMENPPSSAQKDLERYLRAMVRTETAARKREEYRENKDLKRTLRDTSNDDLQTSIDEEAGGYEAQLTGNGELGCSTR